MAAGVKKARQVSQEDGLPDLENARALYLPALSAGLEKVRARLGSIAEQRPQLLHIEGGTTEERVAMALWLAALFNCGDPSARPCLTCPSCLRIAAAMHPDVVFLDGRLSSIKIGDVRGLRPLLGEKPRFGTVRVVILAEAQALGIEAANSLLKILEDPVPDTCFVFTAPQRERLLPTLISRGWVVTLPWEECGGTLSPEELAMDETLANFLLTGTGWFGQSQLRSSMDARIAQQLMLVVRKALVQCYAGHAEGKLAQCFSGKPAYKLLDIGQLCENCQDALFYQVNPAYVSDALAAGLYRIVNL